MTKTNIERVVMQCIFEDCATSGVTMQKLVHTINASYKGRNPQSAMTLRRRFAATGVKPSKGGTFGMGLIYSILEAMSELTGDTYELVITKNGNDITAV